MKKYHAIVINNSLDNINLLSNLTVLGTTQDGSWTISKIEIDEADISDVIILIQESMKSDQPWYAHIYDELGTELIVVFKDRVFTTDRHSENWSEIVNYGLELHIPEGQLDFVPNTFKNEKY